MSLYTKKPTIPAYCIVQDVERYEREAAIFNARRADAATAIQHPYRRAALVATLASRGYLTVAQCVEFTPETMPQLAHYIPHKGTPVTDEQRAATFAAQEQRAAAEATERERRAALPVNFRSLADACAYFGANRDMLDKWIEQNPWALKTI